MLFRIVKLLSSLKNILMVLLLIITTLAPLEILSRSYNQNKVEELGQYLTQQDVSLILLTVTGDKRFKNHELEKMYREMQIIHILVISAGNINIFLHFIHSFIYRISTSTLFLTIIFIYIYGRFISFPDPFIRALQTIFITHYLKFKGMKISSLKIILFLLITHIITWYYLNLSLSYKLSATYSIAILMIDGVSRKINLKKLYRFLFLNILLTFLSSYLFNMYTFSSMCTSFIANIFITSFYDFAIYLSYSVYLLPNFTISNMLGQLIKLVFSSLFYIIKVVKELTYNICYEY